jgi:hypothetical protein
MGDKGPSGAHDLENMRGVYGADSSSAVTAVAVLLPI